MATRWCLHKSSNCTGFQPNFSPTEAHFLCVSWRKYDPLSAVPISSTERFRDFQPCFGSPLSHQLQLCLVKKTTMHYLPNTNQQTDG